MHDMNHFAPNPECEQRYSVKQLLFEILRNERRILCFVSELVQTVTVTRNENPMNPVVPGAVLDFVATVTPSGAATSPSDVAWTSSDPTNFPVTQSVGDPSGLTASVTVPAGAVITPPAAAGPTVTCTVTNSDGTIAVGTSSPQPIVAADITAVSVVRSN